MPCNETYNSPFQKAGRTGRDDLDGISSDKPGIRISRSAVAGAKLTSTEFPMRSREPGHLTHEGENFTSDDLGFDVIKLAGRTIDKVRIRRTEYIM